MTSTKIPDVEQLERINEAVGRLTGEHGYCEVCANELLKYVGTLLGVGVGNGVIRDPVGPLTGSLRVARNGLDRVKR